jgi:hypothetical protein
VVAAHWQAGLETGTRRRAPPEQLDDDTKSLVRQVATAALTRRSQNSWPPRATPRRMTVAECRRAGVCARRFSRTTWRREVGRMGQTLGAQHRVAETDCHSTRIIDGRWANGSYPPMCFRPELENHGFWICLIK